MAVNASRDTATFEAPRFEGNAAEVFRVFARLGLTAFGGPIAHLGYFREEFVVRRKWLDDRAYAELVGLCQFLPGPASSQVGFALGLMRAGPWGGIAAWTAFTIPSALLMAGFALIADDLSGPLAEGAIHGLKIAAVAIVAQALAGMVRALTPDLRRAGIAVAACASMSIIAVPAAQIGLIAAGALAGLVLCRSEAKDIRDGLGWAPSRRVGLTCFAVFLALLVLLPVLALSDWAPARLADIFYRSGTLVFGGGHVVLPLLRSSLVPGWIDNGSFLAGYGAAQALPGPLFAFASYLGAEALPQAPLTGATVALAAIFLPGLLLIASMLPFRQTVSGSAAARAAIAGVNATVVGILAAALYDPLWTTGIRSIADAGVATAAFLLLVVLRAPPILIVALCALLAVGWRVSGAV